MTSSAPEKDWKYIRKIKNDLLASLCIRINNEFMDILRDESGSEYDKYLALGILKNQTGSLVIVSMILSGQIFLSS